MIANHLTGLAVPFTNLGVGHGFGLGVAVRVDDGLSGTLGTLGAFGWSGMATTYFRIDPGGEAGGTLFRSTSSLR